MTKTLTAIEIRKSAFDWWWCDVGEPPMSYGPFPSELVARRAAVVIRLAMGEGSVLDLAAVFGVIARATEADDENG